MRLHFDLAIRSPWRNGVLTVLRAMSDNPLPAKSKQLFVPQIDNWDPKKLGQRAQASGNKIRTQITNKDAIGFMNVHAAVCPSAIYGSGAPLMRCGAGISPRRGNG